MHDPAPGSCRAQTIDIAIHDRMVALLFVAGPTGAMRAPLAYVSERRARRRSRSSTPPPTRSSRRSNSARSRAASRFPPTASGCIVSDQTANALVVIDLSGTPRSRASRSGTRRKRSTFRPTASGCPRRSRRTIRSLLIDTATLAIAKRIKMKGKNPEHAVFSPDGKWLYVSAEEADMADIVDVGERRSRQVGQGRRPPARHRLPARRQPRVRRGGERRHRQRVRHQDARRHRAHQGRQAQQRRHGASRRQARLRHRRAATARCR